MRLWGSFSFRLALLYALLFTLSVSLLMALYYWASIYQPIEVQESLRGENARLVALYETGGAARLAPELDRRAAATAPRQAYHALIDRNGAVIATNLPTWPGSGNRQDWTDGSTQRWLRFEADIYRDGQEHETEALMLDQRLRDGGRLMIGRDINDLVDIDEAIVGTGIWLLPVTLLLALLGGALMSRAIGRRIEAMSATARRVMDGDLTGRVPVRGGSDDFDRLGGTINAMLDRIEASLDAVRRVSDNVAHELRTPLSRLRADLAELAEAPPDRADALIARADTESERLSRMFDAVLRVSRIEARRHEAVLQPVDLGEILEDAADYHAPQAEARSIRFETAIGSALTVKGDRDLIFQAISNLIDNAVKFTPDGGAVTLCGTRKEGEVVMTLVDQGPGIPGDLITKAGERFFRAPAAAHMPGFGLGLALVRAVAQLHGTTFELVNAAPGLQVQWRFPSA